MKVKWAVKETRQRLLTCGLPKIASAREEEKVKKSQSRRQEGRKGRGRGRGTYVRNSCQRLEKDSKAIARLMSQTRTQNEIKEFPKDEICLERRKGQRARASNRIPKISPIWLNSIWITRNWEDITDNNKHQASIGRREARRERTG